MEYKNHNITGKGPLNKCNALNFVSIIQNRSSFSPNRNESLLRKHCKYLKF